MPRSIAVGVTGASGSIYALRTIAARQAPKFTFSVELNAAGKIAAIYIVAATAKLAAVIAPRGPARG